MNNKLYQSSKPLLLVLLFASLMILSCDDDLSDTMSLEHMEVEGEQKSLLQIDKTLKANYVNHWIIAERFNDYQMGPVEGQLITENRVGSQLFGKKVQEISQGDFIKIFVNVNPELQDFISQYPEFEICARVSNENGNLENTLRLRHFTSNANLKHTLEGDEYRIVCSKYSGFNLAEATIAGVKSISPSPGKMRVRAIFFKAEQKPPSYQAIDYAEFHLLGTIFADRGVCSKDKDPATDCVENSNSYTYTQKFGIQSRFSDVRNQQIFESRTGMAMRFKAIAQSLVSSPENLRILKEEVIQNDQGVVTNAEYKYRILNYPYTYDHTRLPNIVQEIIDKNGALSIEDKFKLEAFLMSVIEGEGTTGGLIIDDPHRSHLEQIQKILDKLNIPSTLTGASFKKLKVDRSDFDYFKALPFGGAHRTPGCSEAYWDSCSSVGAGG